MADRLGVELWSECVLVGELLGYARASTLEQDAALQHDALSAAGCFRTWTDTASGAVTDRPELAGVMDALRPGDTLVVWRLDRLGRSLPHLIETVRGLADRGGPYVTGSTVSFEAVPPSPEEMGCRMSSGMPWYVAESPSGLLGFAYSCAHRDRAAYRWSVDVSVHLAADAHRQGTGRLLYTRLLTVLTDLGHVRAHAGIALPNDASVALHESMGFVQVGTYPQVGWKHGAWRDVGWWSRPLAHAAPTPVEPQRWDGLA